MSNPAYKAARELGLAYEPGDIVRWFEKWGVCVRPEFAEVPNWDWFDEDGTFIDRVGSWDNNISAPFDWSYPGIPETVLVRATAERLTA